MVSITSLLVLAALFTQASQNLPSTSYIKLIDVWYTSLVIIDFIIISCLVLVENIRLKHRNAPIKVLPRKEFLNATYTVPDHRALQMNKNFMIAIASIIIIFILSFIITVLVKR